MLRSGTRTPRVPSLFGVSVSLLQCTLRFALRAVHGAGPLPRLCDDEHCSTHMAEVEASRCRCDRWMQRPWLSNLLEVFAAEWHRIVSLS